MHIYWAPYSWETFCAHDFESPSIEFEDCAFTLWSSVESAETSLGKQDHFYTKLIKRILDVIWLADFEFAWKISLAFDFSFRFYFYFI